MRGACHIYCALPLWRPRFPPRSFKAVRLLAEPPTAVVVEVPSPLEADVPVVMTVEEAAPLVAIAPPVLVLDEVRESAPAPDEAAPAPSAAPALPLTMLAAAMPKLGPEPVLTAVAVDAPVPAFAPV